MSALILAFPLALTLLERLNVEHQPNKPIFVNHTLHEYDLCYLNLCDKDRLIYTSIIYTLGIWVPMVLLAIIHVMMHFKLKQQAELRRHKSSIDPTLQLN